VLFVCLIYGAFSFGLKLFRYFLGSKLVAWTRKLWYFTDVSYQRTPILYMLIESFTHRPIHLNILNLCFSVIAY
jgi:hypothetical protein